MKTKVEALHGEESHVNGHDGCYARWSNHGYCPGVATAHWLNSLGDDDQQYVPNVTVGQVRQNWLDNFGHLKRRTK